MELIKTSHSVAQSVENSRDTAKQTTYIMTQDIYSRYIQFIDVGPQTAATYQKAVNSWRRYLQAQGITSPQRSDVIAYRDELLETRAAGTVQTYMTGVKLFYRWAASEGLCENIADHIKGARISRDHKKDALTPGQVIDLLKPIDRTTVAGARDYAAILLAVTCGLRTIEVSRVDIGDMRTRGAQTVIDIWGKGRAEKDRYIIVPSEAERAIRLYLSEYRAGDPDTAPMFTSVSNRTAGARLTSHSVGAMIKSRLRGAGLDSRRLTAHSLRHTAVTLALSEGVDLREVSQAARHADISTTEIYDHELQMERNRSSRAVQDAIFNTRG